MTTRYFAYGSNLWVPRLVQRVPGAHLVGPAILSGWCLTFSKRGSDGSGKCTIAPTPGHGGNDRVVAGRGRRRVRPRGMPARVHGALYHVPDRQRHLLDRAEALGVGYDRARVRVHFALTGRTESAWTYVGRRDQLDHGALPFAWYREFVVRGAGALGAPTSYLDALRRVGVRSDPDSDRERRERGLLRLPPHPVRA